MSTAAHHPRIATCWPVGINLRSQIPLFLLIAFCGVLFMSYLGKRDLTSSHEARAAQNAQVILDQGHWLVPQLYDGHLELQKPPLYYWLVACIAWLRGGTVDAWAVRLPASLSAFACVLFLYLLGVRSKRPLAGLLAAFILASCLHFTWLARVGRIDMPLTMTITFALGAFHLGNLENSTRRSRLLWHLFGYTSLGLGLLLKGPIALVLPAIVAGAVWLLRDRRWQVGGSSIWWGVPLTLAIASPWYLWANIRTQNQLWEVFFWYHNVERGLGDSETLAAHAWWLYLARAAVDLLPWSLAIPIALYWFMRSREIRQDAAACLGLIWFFAIALFLSCMSFKRADYLLPAYPGMAMFLGVCAERWWCSRVSASASGSDVSSQFARRGFLTILLICLAGWQVHNTWFVASEENAGLYRSLAQEVRSQTRGPVVFFRAEAHALMFHLGRPVDTILEWENLNWWTNRPRIIYYVMRESDADQWREHLAGGALEEVRRTTDQGTGRSLVILRSRGNRAVNP